MADNTERPFSGIKVVINGGNEGVGEYGEQTDKEPELPSVSTFHEVDKESTTPVLIEFDHHGEIIIRHKSPKSVSTHDEFHTESTKPTIVPNAILEGNYSIYPKDKSLDLIAENGIPPTHDEDVKCGNNKKATNISRIPLPIKKVKSSTIQEIKNKENVTRRSCIPIPIRRKVKKPGIAAARSNHKKKGVTEVAAERSNHKKKGVTEVAAERFNHKKKGMTEVTDEISNHKKKGVTVVATERSNHKKKGVTEVATERFNHKKKGVTEVADERFNHKKKGVTEVAAERSNHKKKGVTEVADERFNHKKKGATETVKTCTKKLTNAYKKAMQNTNFKIVKKVKEERCRAKEAAREFNERVRQGNKRRNVYRSAGNIANRPDTGNIANRPDQNETTSHEVPNKRLVAEVRSSMVDRKGGQTGRGIGRMGIREGVVSRESSKPRYGENSIKDQNSAIGDGLKSSRRQKSKEISNDQVLFNQDSEMGDCVPNLHVLAEMKAALVKQIDAVQKEIIALKDPSTEATEIAHSGVYTAQMFDNDSDRIQEEIWEIKRLIITMKCPDQWALQELESRIMDVKGENKKLERNLKRINFKEKCDVSDQDAIENVHSNNKMEPGVSFTAEDNNNVHKPTTTRRSNSRLFKNRVAPLSEESRHETLPDIQSPKEVNEFEGNRNLACKDGLLSPSILESFNICLANLRRNPQDASIRQTDACNATEKKQRGKFTFKGMFQKLKAFFTK